MAGRGLSLGSLPSPLCPVLPASRQGAQLEEDLRILKENFSHFSSGVLMELGVLLSDGGWVTPRGSSTPGLLGAPGWVCRVGGPAGKAGRGFQGC